jgi:hypothetical protein
MFNNDELVGFLQTGLGKIFQGSRDAESLRLSAYKLAKTIRAGRKRSLAATEVLEALDGDLEPEQLNEVLALILETLKK